LWGFCGCGFGWIYLVVGVGVWFFLVGVVGLVRFVGGCV